MKKYSVLPYVFIFILLLIKVSVFRMLIFDAKSFLHIALIEFPMWALLLALIILLVKKKLWLAIGIYNFFVSAIFFAITLYTRYYSTIPSYYDLQQTAQSSSVGNTILLLSNPFDFLFFLDAVLLVLFVRRWKEPLNRGAAKYIVLSAAILCAFTSIYALKQPIVDVSYFAKENGYLQTQLVQFYQRTTDRAHASPSELSAKDLEELKGNEFVPATEQKGFGIAENRHLFIIQVESLQDFVVGKSVGGEEITPNLNALLDESAYFSNVFQQIGAGTTSDTEWIANTGLYPEGMVPTVNNLNGKKVPSLASILDEHGYGAATYHADDVTFWNRDILYPVLGYDEVFTIEEIPDIKQVGFGPADEVLFDFALNELPRQLDAYEYIYSNIVTMTSHTPFVLPDEMNDLNLPLNYEDTYIGNYLQAVHYTDAQIGTFIEHLKQQGLYDESLVVIFGDHSGIHGSPVTAEDEQLLEELLGHPYSMKDRFTIPLIMAGGDLFPGIEFERLGGQVDIMPTILSLMGIESDAPVMGHNLFQYEKNLLGMRYYLPGGSFIQSEQFYKAPGAKLPELLFDMKSMEERAKNSATKEHIRDTQTILNYNDKLLQEYMED